MCRTHPHPRKRPAIYEAVTKNGPPSIGPCERPRPRRPPRIDRETSSSSSYFFFFRHADVFWHRPEEKTPMNIQRALSPPHPSKHVYRFSQRERDERIEGITTPPPWFRFGDDGRGGGGAPDGPDASRRPGQAGPGRGSPATNSLGRERLDQDPHTVCRGAPPLPSDGTAGRALLLPL